MQGRVWSRLTCSSMWLYSANNHPTTTNNHPTAAPPQKPPNIIYSTRTHSQMDQCIKELRRSPYRPVMTALASRWDNAYGGTKWWNKTVFFVEHIDCGTHVYCCIFLLNNILMLGLLFFFGQFLSSPFILFFTTDCSCCCVFCGHSADVCAYTSRCLNPTTNRFLIYRNCAVQLEKEIVQMAKKTVKPCQLAGIGKHWGKTSIPSPCAPYCCRRPT